MLISIDIWNNDNTYFVESHSIEAQEKLTLKYCVWFHSHYATRTNTSDDWN